MDVDDMAFIGPGVNLSEVPAIHQKRTLAFVNTFITNTVSILNNLARTSDMKMQKFEEKLQKMDASLSILEANLASIPGLDKIQTQTTNQPVPQPQQQPQTSPPSEQVKNVADEVVEKSTESQEAVAETVVENADDLTEPDPQYTKFFKMVQFGVPPQAVKLKMQSEGLDPNILDNPKDIPRVAKKNDASSSSSTNDSE